MGRGAYDPARVPLVPMSDTPVTRVYDEATFLKGLLRLDVRARSLLGADIAERALPLFRGTDVNRARLEHAVAVLRGYGAGALERPVLETAGADAQGVKNLYPEDEISYLVALTVQCACGLVGGWEPEAGDAEMSAASVAAAVFARARGDAAADAERSAQMALLEQHLALAGVD